MDNSEFFQSLFGKCSGSKVTLMTLPGKQIRHYKTEDLTRVCQDAKRMGARENTYISVWPRRGDIPDGLRGGSDDTEYMTCLFADCDVLGPAHKDQRLPPSKEALLDYLKNVEQLPTLIVDSGYGLYPFWILKDPVRIGDEKARDKASGTLKGFGKFLIQEFKAKGWALDNAFDPGRMLRAPGSNNFKLKDPAPCRILWESGIFYTLDDFNHYLEVPTQVEREPFPVGEKVAGSAERIMDKCFLAQKMQKEPESVTEPEWKAICSNVALTSDGAEKFHEWSSLYSGYRYEETAYKLSRAQEAKKPCTCAYIRDQLSFPCPEDGCGVKAPVVLALPTKEEEIQNLLTKETLTVQDIFDSNTLGLLAYAKNNCFSEYAQFKLRVKKMGISLRDLERAVQEHKAHSIATTAAADFYCEPSPVQLNGINLNGAMEPPGYLLSMENGVESTHYDESGIVHTALCAEPLVMKRRLENIDSGLEKVELAFYRNGRWKSLVAPRSSVFHKNAIVRYADSGLPATTENAEGVVRYLSAYEVTNTQVIPFTRSIDRVGWFGKEFYPCAVRGEVVYENEGADGEGIAQSICEQGEYELWKKTAEALRQSTFARAVLAASFASPLLELLQHRVIILHLWNSSRSGKTAVLKFALSVWGDPLKLMGNFNSTAVGLERRAGTLKHLPLGLDELQVLNEKRLSPARIVYSLGNGYGKTRGAKNGGLQDVPTWRNCIISTGEQPLTDEDSMDGVSSRVLELYGAPIEDTEFGRSVHGISENHYGFAGKRYIEHLVGQVLSQGDKLGTDYDTLRAEIKARFQGDPGVHLDNIAVLALADAYSSQCLFGLTAEQAHEEALQLGSSLLANTKSLEKEDVVERAWSFVKDWVAANRKRFAQESIPCYGTIEPKHVFIISTNLRQAFLENGFPYNKCIKGFQERGYITTTIDFEGKHRSQTQKKIQGVNIRAICANLSLDNATYPDEFLQARILNR